MAHFTSAQDTDVFAIIYRASCLASATVGIFTQPLWPAFTDAVARHDTTWVNRAAVKIRLTIVLIAGALAILMIVMGAWGIEHLWNIDVSGKRMVVIALALYLFSNLWTHFHYVVLMGLDRIWGVAGLVIVENLAMLGLGRLAIPHFGALGMALAYLVASAAIPAWILPSMLRKRMASTSFVPSAPAPAGASL
jgi:O-antigen/teichoic acid export membrane protein